MLPVIEKLLILQDRDQRINAFKVEQSRIPYEQADLDKRLKAAQARLDSAKTTQMQCESDKKQLELEVETLKTQIAKYQIQQFQTKKNEEYQALGHQIVESQKQIRALEDRELELMEKAEQIARSIQAEQAAFVAEQKLFSEQSNNFKKQAETTANQLKELEAERSKLSVDVDPLILTKYERILKSKGDVAVVGVPHSTCGGCHMKLPIQVIHKAKAAQEVVSCSNCGRILYWTREMEM